MVEIMAHFNRMTVIQGVKLLGTGIISRNKLSPDIILWEAVVYTQIFNPGCKAFI